MSDVSKPDIKVFKLIYSHFDGDTLLELNELQIHESHTQIIVFATATICQSLNHFTVIMKFHSSLNNLETLHALFLSMILPSPKFH
jgi:hypothetical protein